MPLSKKDVDELLRQLALTEEKEINCEQCLALVAEFAEQALVGKPVATGMEAIEQHLTLCNECRDEYEALRRTLDGLEE